MCDHPYNCNCNKQEFDPNWLINLCIFLIVVVMIYYLVMRYAVP